MKNAYSRAAGASACDQPGSGDVLLEHGGADTVLRFAVLVLSRHVIGLLRRGQRGGEASESAGARSPF